MRQAIIKSVPFSPWLIPSTVAALDAINVIGQVGNPVYMAMTVIAATITTNTLGVRLVSRAIAERTGRTIAERIDRIAESAPVKEAMLMGYRAMAEHCAAHHQADEDLPHAVGDGITERIPGLHIVRPPVADKNNQGHVVARASVPAPPPSRPGHVAAARRQRRQP